MKKVPDTNIGADDVPVISSIRAAPARDKLIGMSDVKARSNANTNPWKVISAYVVGWLTTPTAPAGTVNQSVQIASTEDYSMDPATIAALITGIVTLIQQCRKDREVPPTDEELLGAARGAGGVRAIRKSLRAQGYRGRRFRSAVREAIAEMQQMTDEELLSEIIHAPEMEKDEDGNDGLDYNLFA